MKKSTQGNIVFVYAGWLFSTALNFFLLFQMREFYMIWFAAIGVDRFAAGFIDKLLLVVIGVVALGLIVLLESLYRRNTIQTFLWTTGIQLTLIGLFTFGRASLYNVGGFMPVGGWLDIVLWVGVGIALMAAARYRQSQR